MKTVHYSENEHGFITEIAHDKEGRRYVATVTNEALNFSKSADFTGSATLADAKAWAEHNLCPACGRAQLVQVPRGVRPLAGVPECRLCDGLMYADRFRLQAKSDPLKYDKDSGERCRCKGHPRVHPRGKVVEFYECLHADEAAIEKAMLMGTFTHSPIKRLALLCCDSAPF